MLRLFSKSPLEVEQLPSPLSLVLGGQWAGLLSGGPSSASTFGSNPQYMISTQHKAEVRTASIFYYYASSHTGRYIQ